MFPEARSLSEWTLLAASSDAQAAVASRLRIEQLCAKYTQRAQTKWAPIAFCADYQPFAALLSGLD